MQGVAYTAISHMSIDEVAQALGKLQNADKENPNFLKNANRIGDSFI